jgi:hypothetical protein
MLKELYDAVVNRTTEVTKGEFVKRPGDPPHVIHVRTAAGFTRQEVDPPVRQVALARLDDLISLAKKHFDSTLDPARMAVFFEDSMVQLIFDTITGYERATLHMAVSIEHRFFLNRIAGPSIPVKDLRRALRFDLTKCFDNELLIQQVSSLEITENGQTQVSAGRGSESLGKSVLSEARAAAGMPNERQTFNVRRYSNPDLDFRFPVECLLDPDTANAQWILAPRQDSFLKYCQDSLNVIEHRLRVGLEGMPIPIYQGSFTASA